MPLSVQLAKAVVAASAKKLTVPVGVVAVAPTTTSVTVAVQLVEAPAGKVAGEQFTLVVVGCLVTVTAAAVALEEPSCVASPP